MTGLIKYKPCESLDAEFLIIFSVWGFFSQYADKWLKEFIVLWKAVKFPSQSRGGRSSLQKKQLKVENVPIGTGSLTLPQQGGLGNMFKSFTDI